MLTPSLDRGARRIAVWTNWLNRPLSGWWCALGWLAATALFVGMVQMVGGPTIHDSVESVYSTWAIAHGRLSCAYPAGDPTYAPFIAPLYPLLSGGVAALARIGHTVPFPPLGTHCSNEVVAMDHWIPRSGANLPTLWIGCLGWLVLLAGVVALLRAVGRGRCGWEPAVVMLLACFPPVFMAVTEYFHPQDLMAMGLALGGLACVRRGWWTWSGVLFGLAITSQQFALLMLAPLVVVAPRNRRLHLAGAAVGTVALLVLPLVAAHSEGVVKATVLGSGNGPWSGVTVLGALHLQGPLRVAASRDLPIVLAMVCAWWAVRRLGSLVLEPVPLLSLMATSLCLRLVFEENFYGYYFMAVAVTLLLLDVVRGRLGGYLIGWLALMALVFWQVPYALNPLSHVVSLRVWQVILVAPALVWSARPLVSTARHRPGVDSHLMGDHRSVLGARGAGHGE
jgi:hypothetical protein